MSKQSNEYEIVEFMIDKFKLASGIGEPKHRPPVRRYKHETQKYDMGGMGYERKTLIHFLFLKFRHNLVENVTVKNCCCP